MRQLAFTLVEVLIVVAVIGLIGAVVVPHMLRGSTLVAQAATRAIVADIGFARSQAVAKQQTIRVVFHPDKNAYALVDEQGNPLESRVNYNEGRQYVVDFETGSRFEGVEIVSVELGPSGSNGNWQKTYLDQVDLVSSGFDARQVVSFADLGTPDSGGRIVLRCNDARYVIDITAFSGRVTVARDQSDD